MILFTRPMCHACQQVKAAIPEGANVSIINLAPREKARRIDSGLYALADFYEVDTVPVLICEHGRFEHVETIIKMMQEEAQ